MSNIHHPKIDLQSNQAKQDSLSEKFTGSDALGQFSDWLDQQLEKLIQSQNQFASASATRKSLGR